jgi:orotate phosphoribosyltransferase
LIEHLRAHGLLTEGRFYLRSGAESSWYLDARQTTFDGEGAGLVGQVVLDALDPSVSALGGMTLGADPIAVATTVTAWGQGRHLRAFSVRKESKDHGTGGRLVGPVGQGDAVAVIEDTTTTGGALIEAVAVAAEAGLEVRQVIALVDRSGGSVAALFAGTGIPYRALIVPSDLGVE